MSWSDDNEQSLGVDVIGWNLIIIIKKKKRILKMMSQKLTNSWKFTLEYMHK